MKTGVGVAVAEGIENVFDVVGGRRGESEPKVETAGASVVVADGGQGVDVSDKAAQIGVRNSAGDKSGRVTETLGVEERADGTEDVLLSQFLSRSEGVGR